MKLHTNFDYGPTVAMLLIMLGVTGSLRAAAVQSPVVQAPQSAVLLDQAYHAMYNLDFEKAFQKAEQAKALSKDDPLPWVAEACAALFRELDHLHILRSEMFASDDTFDHRAAHTWTGPERKEFDDALAGAERIAKGRLDRDKNDSQALFSLALVNGLRADDAALIAKKNVAALGLTKSANGYAERLLARVPDYYDAYVSTGMGKYIIGLKPAPVRWVLRLGGFRGDQEEGLKELSLAASHGHYLAPFAKILLAFDDLRHNNRAAARTRFEELRSQFPNNPLFAQELAKLDRPPAETGQ